jgi:hypothetical protein
MKRKRYKITSEKVPNVFRAGKMLREGQVVAWCVYVLEDRWTCVPFDFEDKLGRALVCHAQSREMATSCSQKGRSSGGRPEQAVELAYQEVKLYLCVIKHHIMKACGGVEVCRQAFVTSALDGDEWLASCAGHFTLTGRALNTHWMGGWVGPRASLDALSLLLTGQRLRGAIPPLPQQVFMAWCLVKHRDNFTFYPCRESNPDRPAYNVVTVLRVTPTPKEKVVVKV